MMRNFSTLFFLLFITGLYLFTNGAVVPGVIKIANSRFFTGDPEKSGNAAAISNEKTAMAHIRCNDHISHAFNSLDETEFPNLHYKAWDIGFDRYLINARFSLKAPYDGYEDNTYVCEIKYLGGDESAFGNWEIMGLDYAKSS